jgi:hypothetical protein
MLALTSGGFAVVATRLIRESSVLQHCWYAGNHRHLASPDDGMEFDQAFATLYATCDHRRFNTRPRGPARIARISILRGNAQPQVATISLARKPLPAQEPLAKSTAHLPAYASNSVERLTTKKFLHAHEIVTIADAIL